MKTNIILWLLFFSNLLLNASDKEFCDSLTNSNNTFLVKYVTRITENEQIIGYSNSNKYNIADKIKIGNNSLYLCEYQSIYNEPINYLVYIDKNILFINEKAVKYTEEKQGLSFRNIIYSNDKLTIYYETRGGTHYYNYKFIFDKIDNNFKLTKAIYHYRIVTNDDFDLDVIQLDNENTLLSNFKIDEYIAIFNGKYNKKYTIQTQKQPLYKEANENSKTKMYLLKNDVVEIIEEKDDWIYILYITKNNKEIKAWIPKNSLEFKSSNE